MFYCHEILQRNGTFGIVWLASTFPAKVTKRDYERIKVSKKCEEILKYVNHSLNGAEHPWLSLYLSAQLMLGIIKIFNRQYRTLYDQCLECEQRFKYESKTTLRAFTDAKILPAKRLNLIQTTSIDIEYLFYDELSPQIRTDVRFVSETGIQPFSWEWTPEESSLELLTTKHQALPETITMRGSEDLEVNMNGDAPFQDAFSAHQLDLEPADAVFQQLINEPNLSPIKQPDTEGMSVDVPSLWDTPAAGEITAPHQAPDTDKQLEADRVRQLHEETPQVIRDLPQTDQQPTPQSSEDLILPPLETREVVLTRDKRGTRGVKRPRKLLIDNPTYYSKEVLRHNSANAQDLIGQIQLIERPSLKTLTADQIFVRPAVGEYMSSALCDLYKSQCKLVTGAATDPLEPRTDETDNLPHQITHEHDRTAEQAREQTTIEESSRNASSRNISALATPINTATPNQSTRARKTDQPSFRGLTESRDEDVPRAEQTEPVLEAEPVQQNDPEPNIQDIEVIQDIDKMIDPPPTDQIDIPPHDDNLMVQDSIPLIIDDNVPVQHEPSADELVTKSQTVKLRISKALRAAFSTDQHVNFKRLVNVKSSRQEVCQVFSTLLVMAKRRHVSLHQNRSYDEINIRQGERW